MDIRLKKADKGKREIWMKREVFFLFLLISLTGCVYIQEKQLRYWEFTRPLRISFWILLFLTCLLLAVFTVQLWESQKEYPIQLQTVTEEKKDSLCGEIVVLLAIVGVILWGTFSFWGSYAVWGDLFSNPSLILGYLAVILGLYFWIRFSFILMIRKTLLGRWKETSFLYKSVKAYQENTPLLKQVQNRHKTLLLVFGICMGGIFVCAMLGMTTYWYEEYLLLVSAFAIVGFASFLFYWLSDPVKKDLGCIAAQINCMAQGEIVSDQLRLKETSLLYGMEEQLFHIEEAMEKSVQKQMQAERLKIDLITNVSHDLKTPLTSMVGYTDLLKKEELSDTAKDYVEAIGMKQEQLKEMIQDLFDLSKSTAGVEQLNMEVLDMRRLLEQTMGDMEDGMKNTDCTIRIDFSKDPLPFMGDNGKMYRIAQNLLENALKYAMEGTRIYVSAYEKDGMIYMEIKNIAAYEMNFAPEEITERFVRGDRSRSTNGHGLGLAIASSFASNMGGNLEVFVDGDLFKVVVRFPKAK